MGRREIKKLHTVLGKIEALQNATADLRAQERLQTAKSELMRLLSEVEP